MKAKIDGVLGRARPGAAGDFEDGARGEARHAVPRRRDRTQRRIGRGAIFEVVEPQDRNVFGDPNATALTLEHRAERQVVIATENRIEPGLAIEDFEQQFATDLDGPRRAVSRRRGVGDASPSFNAKIPRVVAARGVEPGGQVADAAAGGAREARAAA